MELYEHKLEVLENHCKAVGKDIRKIEKSCWPGSQIFIAPNPKKLEEKVFQWKTKGVSLEDFKNLNLVGTPDECIQKIEQYVNVGVTYFMLFFGDLPSMKGIRLFAETVVKKIKSTEVHATEQLRYDSKKI